MHTASGACLATGKWWQKHWEQRSSTWKWKPHVEEGRESEPGCVDELMD